jgi:hypothetical protein
VVAEKPPTYVRCTIDAVTGGKEGPALKAFSPHARRAQVEGWRYLEIDADHLCHQKVPDVVAELLIQLA